MNVHPTKREVHFLNEDAITERVADAIQSALVSGRGAQSRSYQQVRVNLPSSQVFAHYESQTLLTGGMDPPTGSLDKGKGKAKAIEVDDAEEDGPASGELAGAPSLTRKLIPCTEPTQKKVYSHQKVRTSTQDRTLDAMFPVSRPTQASSRTQSRGSGADEAGAQSPALADQTGEETPEPIKLRDIPESECYLTSVLDLRKEVQKNKHNSMSRFSSTQTKLNITCRAA